MMSFILEVFGHISKFGGVRWRVKRSPKLQWIQGRETWMSAPNVMATHCDTLYAKSTKFILVLWGGNKLVLDICICIVCQWAFADADMHETQICVHVCAWVSVSRALMSKQGLDWLILPRAAHLQFSEHHTRVAKIADYVSLTILYPGE